METILAILVQFVLPIASAFIGYLTAVSKSKADARKELDKATQDRMDAMDAQEERLRGKFTAFLKEELHECRVENAELRKLLKKKGES